VWFGVKLFALLYLFIWIRATLPRFRYDKLMNFGWKVLIPAGLLWILVTAAAVVLPEVYRSNAYAAVIIASGTIAIVLFMWPLFTSPPRAAEPSPEVTAP